MNWQNNDITETTELTTQLPTHRQAIRLTFVNGQLTNCPSDLPEGVIICDLPSAWLAHSTWVQKGMSQHKNNLAGLAKVDSSQWENGLLIVVPDNVVVEHPILIRYLTTVTEPEVFVLRNLIFVGKNSQLTVLQDFSSESSAHYSKESVTQIDLADHAHLRHLKCQNDGAQASHHSEYLIQQATESVLHSSSFALGAKLQRDVWQVNLAGREARCYCRGLAIANNTQHLDFHLTLNHQAPACVSEQVFKAIASDKSRTVFTGKVIVQSSGQQAEAHQLSQNLLLSSLAEVDTRPELEIYTDDIKCSHGASVGQLDPDALFYLQSRGIGHQQASEMLLHAFVQDHLTDSLPAFQDILAPCLNAKLALINGVQCQ